MKAWAMAVGGAPILDLGHTGAVQVPTDRMTELPPISKKFEQLCDATLSIGVGMSLSESYTAMRFSMLKGGDRISLYHVEMEDVLNDANKEEPGELSGLIKAQEGMAGLQDESNQAGFAASAQHGAGGQFAAKPAETHAPTAAPPPPDQPDPGSIDFSSNTQNPNGGQVQPEGEGEEDPRTAVVNALKQIKQQAPVLEQLKQTNPDAFNAVKEVVDAMILMAQGMATQDESVQKSEHEDKLPGGLADKKKPSDFDQEELKAGIAHEKEHTNDETLAQEIAMDHLTEDPHYYSKLKKDAPGTYHEWAVGTTKQGKIKVAHKDIDTNAPQGTGWHSVRAGMVMSKDGHAISARNPDGK